MKSNYLGAVIIVIAAYFIGKWYENKHVVVTSANTAGASNININSVGSTLGNNSAVNPLSVPAGQFNGTSYMNGNIN